MNDAASTPKSPPVSPGRSPKPRQHHHSSPRKASRKDNVPSSIPIPSVPASSLIATLESTVLPSPTLVCYTRKELLFLSKSVLVRNPTNMPAFRDWYGDWSAPISPRKENDLQGASRNANRSRRGDLGDEESKPASRSQIAHSSQMGSFRHHSRLEDKGERDAAHERLRNLSETYDRNKLLANAASRRDILSGRNLGSSSSTTRVLSGETEKEHRESGSREASRREGRGERSQDWRRGVFRDAEGEEDRRTPLKTEGRDYSDDPRARRHERSGNRLRNGARSPSLDRERASVRRNGGGRDREAKPGSRSRSRSTQRQNDSAEIRSGEGQTTSRRNGRLVSDKDSRRDTRTGKEKARDTERDANGDRQPAWMGDYQPNENIKMPFMEETDGSHDVDDLQAWKRSMKEKLHNSAVGQEKTFAGGDGDMDNEQRFQPQTKGEDESRATELKVDATNSEMLMSAPPGIPSGQDAVLSLATLLPEVELSEASVSQSGGRALNNPRKAADAFTDARVKSATHEVSSQNNVSTDLQAEIRARSNGQITPTPFPPDSIQPHPAALSLPGSEIRTSSPGTANSFTPSRGSRFAKFWDNKPREATESFSQNVSPALEHLSQPNVMPLNSWPARPFDEQRLPRPDTSYEGAFLGSTSSQLGHSQMPGLSGSLDQLRVGPDPRSSESAGITPIIKSSADQDRMMNLLSMLEPQIRRPVSSSRDLSHQPRNVNGSDDGAYHRAQVSRSGLIEPLEAYDPPPPHFRDPYRIPRSYGTDASGPDERLTVIGRPLDRESLLREVPPLGRMFPHPGFDDQVNHADANRRMGQITSDRANETALLTTLRNHRGPAFAPEPSRSPSTLFPSGAESRNLRVSVQGDSPQNRRSVQDYSELGHAIPNRAKFSVHPSQLSTQALHATENAPRNALSPTYAGPVSPFETGYGSVDFPSREAGRFSQTPSLHAGGRQISNQRFDDVPFGVDARMSSLRSAHPSPGSAMAQGQIWYGGRPQQHNSMGSPTMPRHPSQVASDYFASSPTVQATQSPSQLAGDRPDLMALLMGPSGYTRGP